MYQKLTIVGRLGGDPEMRYMPNGTAVTNFSVATNRTWTDKNTSEKVTETTWFRVEVWGNRAETCNQWLTKGSTVLIDGRLKSTDGGPRVWTGKDGVTKASFEVTADNVTFVTKAAEQQQQKVTEDEMPW